MNTSKKPKKLNIKDMTHSIERLYKSNIKSEAQKDQLRQQYLQKDKEMCSIRPKMSDESKTMVAHKDPKPVYLRYQAIVDKRNEN